MAETKAPERKPRNKGRISDDGLFYEYEYTGTKGDTRIRRIRRKVKENRGVYKEAPRPGRPKKKETLLLELIRKLDDEQIARLITNLISRPNHV